jgi:hypothetical protein
MILEKQIITVVDQPNKNGRIYSRAALEKVVQDYLGKESFGTLGGYSTPFEANFNNNAQNGLDLEAAAFTWTNLRLEGDNLVADIKVLATPYGNILKRFADDMAIRSIGSGTVKQDGTIGDDFKLYGLVAFPKDSAA